MHPSRARPETWTLSHLVPVPENRFAIAAAQRVAGSLTSPAVNPLVLHGPPGSGKTHLVRALVHEACRKSPGLSVAILNGGDFKEVDSGGLYPRLAVEADADLLIVEDIQHLPARAAETSIQLFDERLAHALPVVVTTALSPRRLVLLPARLTSRLVGGLVVGIAAFSCASRLAILQALAQRRQFAVRPEILAWLAEHLPGNGRQLGSALDQLELLARIRPVLPLELGAVVEHFQQQAAAARPSMERIARRVGACFQVEPRQMQTASRHRRTLLPRQLTMYLARDLTGLSLEAIGAYFSGRDHTTVLHACRKVEAALTQDAALSATVRELKAELGSAARGFADQTTGGLTGDIPVENPLTNGLFPVGDG